MVLKSYSKVNLSLRVNNKLKSGLHEIQSYYCLVNLSDKIKISKIKRKKDKITTSFFEISSENYAIIQIHKNFEMYLNPDLTKATKQDKSRKTSKENTKAPKKLNKTSKLNSTKNSK